MDRSIYDFNGVTTEARQAVVLAADAIEDESSDSDSDHIVNAVTMVNEAQIQEWNDLLERAGDKEWVHSKRSGDDKHWRTEDFDDKCHCRSCCAVKEVTNWPMPKSYADWLEQGLDNEHLFWDSI